MVRKLIKIIALIELLIGISALVGLAISSWFDFSRKSPNVFVFVLLSAAASSAIGIGLFGRRHWARTILIFFSGYIVLTKILIFMDLLHLNGEIITFMPASIKNCISIAYHGFIVLFFTHKETKGYFSK